MKKRSTIFLLLVATFLLGVTGFQFYKDISVDASIVDVEAFRELPFRERLNVKKTGVPVLLPADEDLLHTTRIVESPYSYDASLSGDGYVISIFAESRSIPSDGNSGEYFNPTFLGSSRVEKAIIGTGEGFRLAFWNEFGIAFGFYLFCDGGMSAPMCKDETFIREIIRELKLIKS